MKTNETLLAAVGIAIVGYKIKGQWMWADEGYKITKQ